MPQTAKRMGTKLTKLSTMELKQLSEFLKISSKPVATHHAAEQELLMSLSFMLRHSARSC